MGGSWPALTWRQAQSRGSRCGPWAPRVRYLLAWPDGEIARLPHLGIDEAFELILRAGVGETVTLGGGCDG